MKEKNTFLELYFILNEEAKTKFSAFLKKHDEDYYAEFQKCKGILSRKNRDIATIKLHVFEKLYPNLKYKDVSIRLLFSDLLSYLKKFLYYDQNQQQLEYNIDLNYLKFLRINNQNRLFENQHSTILKKLDEQDSILSLKFEKKYEVIYELCQFESTTNRFDHSNFNSLIENLDISHLIKKLHHYIELLTIESISSSSIHFPLIKESIDLIYSKKWDEIPEISIYLKAIKLIKNSEDENNFFAFKELMNSNSLNWGLNEFQFFGKIALNYCIKKINQFHAEFYVETLHLYNHGVIHKWLLENGKMNGATYKNIISLCIRMKEIEQAEYYLESYKPLINEDISESYYQFNKARIHKEKQEYKKALVLLNSNIFKDPLIEVNARIEVIKILFEQKEYELCINKVQSAMNWIKRNKELGYHREYYINFLKLTLRVCTSAFSGTKEENKDLIKMIKTEARMVEKSWLLDQFTKAMN